VKNQYVGDINDFAKYGLLKVLARAAESEPLRLGVIWYLTPDDRGRDGKEIRYLQNPLHLAADADLLAKLHEIVGSTDRGVRLISQHDVLPVSTIYYDAHVPAGASRESWFGDACSVVEACDLIFLDPDNGLAPAGGREGPPYATVNEIRALTSRGQSVVTIQFFGRRGSHREQMQRRLSELERKAPANVRPFALRWRS